MTTSRLQTLLESPSRVLLGPGAVSRLETELSRLGVERVLVVTTARGRRSTATVVSAMGARVAGVFAESAQHVPASVARAAIEAADAAGADAVVAIGGGSAIGVGKAVAAERPVRLIAVPTTYSGSEMTDLYGLTEGGKKRTARSANVRPALVLYDPELTLGLPPQISASSGLNALAHAVEALWVVPEHPAARRAAREAIAALHAALPRVVRSPEDLEARTQALRGSFLAGRSLEGGVALHHKLCHLLGGRFGLPHAETHAVLLPHVTHYNARAAPEAMATVVDILGGPTAATALHAFSKQLGAPTALEPFGLSESDVSMATEAALEIDASANPRPVDRDGIRMVLDGARRGVLDEHQAEDARPTV